MECMVANVRMADSARIKIGKLLPNYKCMDQFKNTHFLGRLQRRSKSKSFYFVAQAHEWFDLFNLHAASSCLHDSEFKFIYY